jgi:hypothetical protein
MKRTRVSSSCLKSVGYDGVAKILEVEFVDGRLYRYFSVPQFRYSELMQASSHGSYYSRHIKEEGYAYEEVS